MGAQRILIIDDEAFVLDVLSSHLRDKGYVVTVAEDGQEGFNKAVTDDFDLIVTDIKMPKWNGAESIYGLNLVNHKAKIIVVSGYLEDALLAELNEYENVVKIFSKPLDILKFSEYLEEIFKV